MRVTVQQCYLDPEFKRGAYLMLRLRAKKLGNFKAGDKVEVLPFIVNDNLGEHEYLILRPAREGV